jgi:hypothetical protein
MKRALFAISALFILASVATAQPAPLSPDVLQPAPAPVVVAAAPTSPNADLFTAAWTLLGTFVIGIIGYLSPAVKQALTKPGGAAAFATPGSVAATMVAALQNDPALRTQIMAELSRVISSGVPGAVLTAGAGLIPGVGPIAAPAAALLEPAIHAAIMNALAIHTPPAVAAATTPAIAPVTNQLTDLLSVVNGLRAQVEALVPKGSI